MSTLPAWTNSLSVGNLAIDEQHRQLIAFCNRMADFSAAKSPSAVSNFHGLLSDGVRLLDEHFREEEKILLINQCPSFEIHRAEHNQFREIMADMLKDGVAGELHTKDIYEFAKEKLIAHMLGRDLLDKDFMREGEAGTIR
jgi:hemerythrin-like metal-binding protein